MNSSPTAEMFASILNATRLKQREIAAKAGFFKPNVIMMMKQGTMKIPIERIPALAEACGVDPPSAAVMRDEGVRAGGLGGPERPEGRASD